TIGRFTSFDSLEADSGDPMMLHKYLYANADPIYYLDPTGNAPSLSEVLTVVGIGVNILNLALDGVKYANAVARHNTAASLQAAGWLSFDAILLFLPFSGGPRAGVQIVTTLGRLVITAENARTLFGMASAAFGLVHFALSNGAPDWNVAEHQDQPS